MKTSTLILLLLALLSPLSPSAHAYFSVMDTADVVTDGRYRAIIEPQFVLTEYDGVNFVGHFDAPVAQDSAIRGTIGFGKVDFQLGGLYKWSPIPDVEGQPAIGVAAGLLYSRIDSDNQISLRVLPLISKSFETDIGRVTPYGSIPLAMTSVDEDTVFPVQLVAGSEWKTIQWENLSFLAEVGFNINKSFSYVALGAALYFGDAPASASTAMPVGRSGAGSTSSGGGSDGGDGMGGAIEVD